MDLTNNTGLLVVSLDGCLPSSAGVHGGNTTDSALKSDCIYTVAMMGQDEVLVPSSASCFQQSMMDNDLLEISQPQEKRPPIVPLNSEQDENYYSLILNYLSSQTFPDDVDEARRIMITRRSRHYCVIDGQLFYGQKFPKKVVCDLDARKKLLTDSHIINDTGVHVGVQKMYLQLKKDFFWCGMYMDITTFVRDCKLCVDIDLPVAAVKTLANKRKYSLLKQAKRITRSASIGCLANQFKNKNEVWRKIEFRLSGPYSENKYLLTIADPCSKWVEGKVAEEHCLALQSADFLANTMCHVGFTEVATVGFTPDQIDILHTNFVTQFNHITSNNNIKEAMSEKLTTFSNNTILCPWISDLLKSLITTYPCTWEKQLQKFLFDFRNKSSNFTQSPFDIMYKRHSIAIVQEENKENAGKRYSRRLQNTLNKSVRTQPKRQMVTRALKQKRQKLSQESAKEETSLSEDEDDPLPLPEVPSHNVTQNNAVVEEVRASTVAVVQAFLSATREERSRRGRYQRYSIELREEIADYALKHGSLEAVKHFSEKLNTQLSESTVRNFAKTYQDFSPLLQEQIGLYATTHTITATTEHFVSLGYQVRPTVIRKFKKRYLEKYPPEKVDGEDASSNKKTNAFDPNLKEEIGQYAEKFGVAAAVDHYSNKLETPIKDVTVRKLKKKYLDKLKCQETVLSQTETLQTETMEVVQASFNVLNASPPTQTIMYNQQSYQSLMPHSISFHPGQNNIDHTSVTYQQTLPQVLTHNSQLVFSQTPFQTHPTYPNNFNQLQTSNIHLPATNIQLRSSTETTQMLSTEHPNSVMDNNPQMIISQHPILITHTETQGENNMTVHLDNLSTLPAFESPLTQQHSSSGTINFLQQSTVTYGPSTSSLTHSNTAEANVASNFSPVDIIDNSDAHMIRVIQLGPNIVCGENKSSELNKTLVESVPANTPSSSMVDNQVSVPKKIKNTKVKHKNKKCQKNGKGRSKYVTYSPEIRAEIGSYAASHGNQQAIYHFRDILGKDLPESTVRGLKEKYLAKMEQCSSAVSNTKTITSLGFAPRGRPMRLGKYDDIIRQCIRDLVSNGERVTSFLAITTAKQVLTENEPQLLAENGGNIQLTTNWAKSFLKRIGIHNNS